MIVDSAFIFCKKINCTCKQIEVGLLKSGIVEMRMIDQ